jgi:hypothetical protein
VPNTLNQTTFVWLFCKFCKFLISRKIENNEHIFFIEWFNATVKVQWCRPKQIHDVIPSFFIVEDEDW